MIAEFPAYYVWTNYLNKYIRKQRRLARNDIVYVSVGNQHIRFTRNTQSVLANLPSTLIVSSLRLNKPV